MNGDQLVQILGQNAAIILPALAAVAGLIALALYARARMRHIGALRERLNGAVRLPQAMQEALSKVLNVDSAEFATIGAVTFVDIAWHYSMADPQIWDHFHGPAASHMIDAMQNLDVLKASMGDQATTILGHLTHYFNGLEATQGFQDAIAKIAANATAAAMAMGASSSTLVESLGKAALSSGAEAKANTAAATATASAVASDAAGLLHHIPVVTIGFASYRAWKRAQGGAGLGRNLEFAAIEVATRTGGGLVGAQVGGAVGTAIVPGAGTIIGGIAGAVAGAIGGAILGEEFKQRHVKGAQQKLDQTLVDLGEYHLQHPGRFRELTEVFTSQEHEYEQNLRSLRGRLLGYSVLPWRIAWPNEKLVLLQETVKMAQGRLNAIKKGALDAVDQLTYMRDRRQHREMGLILWNDIALRQQLTVEPKLVGAVDEATSRLRREVTQHGLAPQAATA